MVTAVNAYMTHQNGGTGGSEAHGARRQCAFQSTYGSFYVARLVRSTHSTRGTGGQCHATEAEMACPLGPKNMHLAALISNAAFAPLASDRRSTADRLIVLLDT